MGKDDEYDFTEEMQFTIKKLAAEIAKLTPLDMEKIKAMLPIREDKERFQRVIEAVNKAQSQNEKVAALEGNVAGLSEAAIAIVKKFLL